MFAGIRRPLLKSTEHFPEPFPAADVISVIFTVSPDLNAAFPAGSARELGFSDVPLICSVEIDVPGALERTIRVMAHVETSLSKAEISHIYLGAAKSLRRDIAQ